MCGLHVDSLPCALLARKLISGSCLAFVVDMSVLHNAIAWGSTRSPSPLQGLGAQTSRQFGSFFAGFLLSPRMKIERESEFGVYWDSLKFYFELEHVIRGFHREPKKHRTYPGLQRHYTSLEIV